MERSARLLARQIRAHPAHFSTSSHARNAVTDTAPAGNVKNKSPMSRMPTKTLIRSLVLTSLMGKEWLLRPSLAALDTICRSKNRVCNADKNPILNQLMRWALYNHFAAGASAAEVARSAKELKDMGYQGIILGYAKEVVLANPTDTAHSATIENGYSPAEYRMVEEWKQGTLQTLEMIGPGDFLAVKITGAGPIALDAMKAHEPMPKVISDAMNEICVLTRKQSARLWMDAEQQTLQPAIDEWTIELMQKYNENGQALVYNTIQAYLKGARSNANRHVLRAAREGWTLGVKLVRGAYIENEVRSLIHDTKADSDQSYDDIADMLISQKMPEGSGNLPFPKAALFLATHNEASAEKAITTYRQRSAAGLPTALLECGQIMGMADELSCALLERYEECQRDPQAGKAPPPGVFKFLAWGTVSECMGYMYRRAVENRGAVERTEHMVTALKQELRRRVWGR